ncbi:MAG: VCBS repeat-containing protein [Candidatus Alcyoniella australis]|nr:VCBS repeat-containing protein [Candidatus Alcyoniella australis]
MRRIFRRTVVTLALAIIFTASAAAQIEQLPGFPQTVALNSMFWGQHGLTVADIDGDPQLELIAATMGQRLIAWDPDGTELFNVALSGLAATPAAVGDVLGDSSPEIVVNTRDLTGGNPQPKLHVFSGSGALLNSTALPHSGAMYNEPTLADLDGDGKLEIIVGEHGSGVGYLYAYNGDLSAAAGPWPVALDHVPATSAAVGDVDNDGQPEIAICSFRSLYLFERDGALMDGFPRTIADETYSYGSPALVDLDGDGTLEILSVTHGDLNRVHATDIDGAELEGWPFDLGDAWSYCPPAVGDIDQDGNPEVVVGRAGGLYEADNLFVIEHDGSAFPGFPLLITGGVEGNIVLADISGDSRLEIIFTNNLRDGDYGFVFGVDAQGAALPGFPLRPYGIVYLNGPTLADLDRDGSPELVVLGSYLEQSQGSVNVYTCADWSFGPGMVHWATSQADNRRSGMYNPYLPDDDDDDTGDDDDADDDDAGGGDDDDCPGDDDTGDDAVCCG